jgi:hypothetical protein
MITRTLIETTIAVQHLKIGLAQSFESDKPSSLFGQFGDERVTTIALELDAAIARAILSMTDRSLN